MAFCRKYQDWTEDDWKRVIWSDESKINRFQSDGKQYYWRRPHERIQKHHVKQTVKHGSLMIWGCFTWWHMGPLVKIEGIMKKEDYLQILQTNLPDFLDECTYPEEEMGFQQDGDPKHTAKIVKKWLDEPKFQKLMWPAQSPDLNPIENVWSLVKRQLGLHERAPKNMAELMERVRDEWTNIPRETIQHMVESMPRRIASVKKNKGLWTKY